jgi:type II secretory pathway predicted ATPase ExeA
MHSPQHRSQGRPFLAAPRPAFYFPAGVVEAAREELERGVRRAEGVGLVVGQAGVGKSMLLAKLAEDLRDDFDVALLSGARICTRRALWQSVLAEIGEAYRGLEENDLRMSVVERVRGLAATCSGLVILVDEAQTLPTRLVDELRLLSTVPTPMPAVHIVLAGSRELEERLANPKLESLAQRIVIRTYLEPFDHAETCRYVRAQCREAGLDWDRRFEVGCDDTVFSLSDGLPRLINQICDHALVTTGDAKRLRPTDIEVAWRDIQRLPAPEATAVAAVAAVPAPPAERPISEPTTISFGSLDDDDWVHGCWDDTPVDAQDKDAAIRADGPHIIESVGKVPASPANEASSIDPIQGPDVEFFFDASLDPFDDLFEEESMVERHLSQGPDDFRNCQQVVSREGGGLGHELAAIEEAGEDEPAHRRHDASERGGRPPTAIQDADRAPGAGAGAVTADRHEGSRSRWESTEEPSWQDQYEYRPDRGCTTDASDLADFDEAALEDDGDDVPPYDDEADQLDANVIVVEEDLVEDPSDAERSVFAVRPADYRRLFARLRRK